MSRLAALIIMISCLSSCGLKGPLYLPEKSQPVIVTPTATANASNSSESSSSSSAASVHH